MEELNELGCTSVGEYCSSSTPKWVYSTTYWTGTAVTAQKIILQSSSGLFQSYYYGDYNGVRPVIEIPLTEF